MMYKLLTAAACMVSLVSFSADAQTWVNGYTKKNGTYVQGHYRSTRDNNPYNNYSTQGNTNPYTGKQGTVNPYNNNNTYGSFGAPKPAGGILGRRY